MRLHDIAFYAILFFLFGVLFASFKINLLIIIFCVFLASLIILSFGILNFPQKISFLKTNWIAGLLLFAIAGGFYYIQFSKTQAEDIKIIFDKKIVFEGLVVEYPKYGDSQDLIIKLSAPYNGNILLKTRPYPRYKYGDMIKFEGIIEEPKPANYADYLSKERIFGVSAFPKAELLARGRASIIKSTLFEIKENVLGMFQKTLSPSKAAFMAGITLGEQAEFSKEFKEKMKNSGTAHIVALSGYNITIVGLAVASIFGYFFRRRIVFILTILIVIGFVVMTGAEASVVRAAIMGGIVLLGQQIGRVHSMRNVIAVAALIMVLFNPKVLRFDIGFQLSFLALIGIIYLAPFIKKILKMKNEAGFLSWKKNFLETTSAQMAVAPLLIINFGSFNLTSFLANILILEAIPITMFLGFLMAAIGFIFMPFAIVIGWFAGLFLSYEFAIIDIFSKISIL
ncbi:MAG: ComEC/Rec2 family competence protein [Patescibacteria group bacterium]